VVLHQVGGEVAVPQLMLELNHLLTPEGLAQAVPLLTDLSQPRDLVVEEILDQVALVVLKVILIQDFLLNQVLDVDLWHNVHQVFLPPETFPGHNVNYLMAPKESVVQQGPLLGPPEDLSKVLILDLFQHGQMVEQD